MPRRRRRWQATGVPAEPDWYVMDLEESSESECGNAHLHYGFLRSATRSASVCALFRAKEVPGEVALRVRTSAMTCLVRQWPGRYTSHMALVLMPTVLVMPVLWVGVIMSMLVRLDPSHQQPAPPLKHSPQIRPAPGAGVTDGMPMARIDPPFDVGTAQAIPSNPKPTGAPHWWVFLMYCPGRSRKRSPPVVHRTQQATPCGRPRATACGRANTNRRLFLGRRAGQVLGTIIRPCPADRMGSSRQNRGSLAMPGIRCIQ
ncbi:hypothetical protein ABIE18_004259 [Arthrobacter sp. 2762]